MKERLNLWTKNANKNITERKNVHQNTTRDNKSNITVRNRKNMLERTYDNLEVMEIPPILRALCNYKYTKFKLFIDNQYANRYGKKHFRLKNGVYLHSISEVIDMIRYFATNEVTITIKMYNLINTKCLAKVTIYNNQ